MRIHSIATIAALVSVSACARKPSTETSDSAAAAAAIVLSPQDLATARTQPVSAVVLVSGNLDPADVVQLRAQVPGTVQGVRADRGTRVRRGEVLAVIEAAGVRSQAAAAKAQETVALQRLAAAKRLYEAGAVSEIEYKTAQAGYEGARAMSAAASESAERASIASPIDGMVSARFVSGGEAVNPGQPLFTVVNSAELELAGRMGLQDAARVHAGQAVTFTLDAYPNQTFRGRVARVDPTADLATRQVGVYARLSNAGGRIVGGQYARGRIETGSSQSAVVIPESALIGRSGDTASVFVVLGNKVAERRVTLGPRDEGSGLIAVFAGVRNGEQVLLNPSTDIGDGMRVSVAQDTVIGRANGAK